MLTAGLELAISISVHQQPSDRSCVLPALIATCFLRRSREFFLVTFTSFQWGSSATVLVNPFESGGEQNVPVRDFRRRCQIVVRRRQNVFAAMLVLLPVAARYGHINAR